MRRRGQASSSASCRDLSIRSARIAVRDAGEQFFIAAAAKCSRAADAEFKSAVRELGQATGRKDPSLYMPLRAALTGATHGPELAPLLG